MKARRPYPLAAIAATPLAFLSAMLGALTSNTATTAHGLDVNASQPVTHRVTVQPITESAKLWETIWLAGRADKRQSRALWHMRSATTSG